MQYFIIILLTSSAAMSVLAILYMALSSKLANRYSEKGRYYAWLIIIFGLIIPFRPQFDKPIIRIDMPNGTITPVVHTGNEMPVLIPLTSLIDNAAPSSAAINTSLWRIVTIVWLLGMIVFIFYHIVKHRTFVKMVNRWGKNTPDEQILFIFQELKFKMGINKRIDLYICPCVSSPTMISFINPRIFLPTENIEYSDLNFILKHELVHHKRKDLLYKYLVLTATAIHWFNPVVYLVAKVISELCEMSCDSDVVRSADTDTRLSYSETIIGMARYQSKLKTVLSTDFYGGKKSLKNRISSIMDTHKKKAGFALFCFALVVSVFSSVVFAISTTNSNVQTAFANQIDFQSSPFDWDTKEIAKKAKEIELADAIINFDKIDNASVYLFLHNEMISANILLMTTEEISYSEMDSIALFVSEGVESLDKGNINIKVRNTNTLYPNLDSKEIAKKAKEIELANGIINFDKVDDASVYLFLHNEMISANIVLMTTEEISYSEMDSIALFVSEGVESLGKGNINIKVRNANTLYPNL